MLILAAFFDFKTRLISDKLWIVFGIIAAILIFFESNLEAYVTKAVISLIILPVVILIWKFGFFGGADAFALIILAVLVPDVKIFDNQITPFTTFTNAIILSVSLLFFNILRNVSVVIKKKNIFEGFSENRVRKLIALFLGYKAKNPKYGFSFEKMVDGEKKFDFTFKNAEKTEFVKGELWVTPTFPLMLFIAIGFFIQLFYGDIILNFLIMFF